MRILVLYATRGGSTRGIAQAVARELRDRGNTVRIRPVRTGDVLADYDAAVIGSAVYARHWRKDALSYLDEHEKELSRMPIAYFSVCLSVVKCTEQSKEEEERYRCIPSERCPAVEPVSTATFAGCLSEEKLAPGERQLVRLFGVEEGDYRDWDAIRAWARSVHEAFAGRMAAV